MYLTLELSMNLSNVLKNIKSEDDKIYFKKYIDELNKYIEIESKLIKINEDLSNLIKEKHNTFIINNNDDKKQEKILYNSYIDLNNSIINIHNDILNNKVNFLKLLKLYKNN